MRNDILNKGAAAYGADVTSFKLLGGFDNNVYECKNKDGSLVLKFISGDNDLSSLKSEINWIYYLSEHGMNVTKPILSQNGNIIETISCEGEDFILIAFEKAEGEFLNDLESNPAVIKNWGHTMGKMHALAKTYEPLDPAIKHPEWNEGKVFTEYPDSAGEHVYEKWINFINKLKQLPKDKNSYGLIHHDLHQKNFYINGNEIILFDFGDCEYNWFVYDIAISLYHAIQAIPETEQERRETFALNFLDAFMKGYNEENSLGKNWLLRLQLFLNYRQVYSFVYLSKFLKIDESNVNVKKALARMRGKIENDIPYIDLNIS
ncbi:aminoglycoside phosphotransferase [Bacillus sp. V3-13]|uniref:phosphotransferase enzyme family protein n=1 Tax=Bacillus sp. V3-13 TaxID=2053728 RepID=UPI000C760CE3|nr:phosphotransferase [Bacillus sp. V3-13]PLR75775.1 aminoglycoside phosphotransferase [Bacillus sp. V3-13]